MGAQARAISYFDEMFFMLDYKYIWVMVLVFVAGYSSEAQNDSVRLTKDFAFADGIYLSARSWQQNQPDRALPDDWNPIINPRTGMLRLRARVAVDSVWGIAYAGVPYVRLAADSIQSPLPTFAGLKVRGKICYYSYETTRTDSIPFAVYNPQYGYAFRRAKVERTRPVLLERMLHFETLKTLPFNRNNLLAWTEDDREIYRTIEWIEEWELGDKLYKALLVYDDRNEVFVLDRAF